jgi:hypothetical protein
VNILKHENISNWILNELDETYLLMFVNATGIKINGFREISPNNIKQNKSKIISELLEPRKFPKTKSLLIKYIEKIYDQEKIEQIKLLPLTDLESNIRDKEHQLVNILIVLIFCGEQREHSIARDLYNSILQDTASTAEDVPGRLIKKSGQTLSPEKEQVSFEKKISDLEKKNYELSKKNTEYQTELHELKAQQKKEQQEWKKNKKLSSDEIKEMNKVLEGYQMELKEHEANLVNAHLEISKLKSELTEKDKTIKETLEVAESEKEKTTRQFIQNIENKSYKIAILGQININTLKKSEHVEFQVIHDEEINYLIDNKTGFQEFWMVSFQFSPQKQKKIRNAFQNEKFFAFSNIEQIQEYMRKKEGRQYEQRLVY